MDTLTHDWKKKAAAASSAADSEAIEKAFMDQAYTFVANKAGDLMTDPYRLGFEVVYKNDDNTRMVGIFAFRIDDELLYVPCFFLSGEIKGTDLLYRHDSKKFVPLNRDWVAFLLEKSEAFEGKGIDKDHLRKMPTDVNLRELASPPSRGGRGIGKYASVEEKPTFKDLEKMAGAHVEAFKPVLKSFLQENGMEAFDKLAGWIGESPRFTKTLLENVAESEFLLDDLDYPVKEAAAKSGSLRLITGAIPEEGIKSASEAEDFFKRGFALLDDRSKDLSVITQDDTEQFQGISEAGIYDIIMGDGSLEEALVTNGECVAFPSRTSLCPSSNYEPGCYANEVNESVVVLRKSKESGVHSEVVGIQKKDMHTTLADEDMLKKTMSSGKTYRIFDTKSGALTDPIYCKESKTKNGIKCYSVCTSYEQPWTLKVNPDYDGFDLEACVIGGNNRFVEIAAKISAVEHSPQDEVRIDVKPTQNVGNMKHLLFRISEAGYKRACVVRTSEDFYRIHTGSKYLAEEVGFKSACVGLAKGLAIPGEQALAIMDKVAADGKFAFFIQPCGTKEASVIRTLNEPAFENTYDNDFGVEVEPVQQYTVDTEADFEDVPEQRVGDAMDPRVPGGIPGNGDSVPMDVLRSAPPEALAQYAKMHNLPNVFEHGLVGSLVKTYDSVAMIDKYVPEIESALDSIGRILFLFWWKPGDFQEAYGVDDMTNLEHELLSNFKSVGELTLDLIKRSKKHTRGTPPLPS